MNEILLHDFETEFMILQAIDIFKGQVLTNASHVSERRREIIELMEQNPSWHSVIEIQKKLGMSHWNTRQILHKLVGIGCLEKMVFRLEKPIPPDDFDSWGITAQRNWRKRYDKTPHHDKRTKFRIQPSLLKETK